MRARAVASFHSDMFSASIPAVVRSRFRSSFPAACRSSASFIRGCSVFQISGRPLSLAFMLSSGLTPSSMQLLPGRFLPDLLAKLLSIGPNGGWLGWWRMSFCTSYRTAYQNKILFLVSCVVPWMRKKLRVQIGPSLGLGEPSAVTHSDL